MYGGVLFLSYPTSLFVNSSTFKNNSALRGGVCYYQETESFDLIFDSCLFFSNIGFKNGGIIEMESKLAFFNYNNQYFNNIANYGNEFAGSPIRMDFKILKKNSNHTYCDFIAPYTNNTGDYFMEYYSKYCEMEYEINDQAPGVMMNIKLEFDIVDAFNQIVSSLNG